jgi:hypothetical protein
MMMGVLDVGSIVKPVMLTLCSMTRISFQPSGGDPTFSGAPQREWASAFSMRTCTSVPAERSEVEPPTEIDDLAAGALVHCTADRRPQNRRLFLSDAHPGFLTDLTRAAFFCT